MILALAITLAAASAIAVPKDLPVTKLDPNGPGAMEGVVIEDDPPAPPPKKPASAAVKKPAAVSANPAAKPLPKRTAVALAPRATPAPSLVPIATPSADPIGLSLVAIRKSGVWPKAVELTNDGLLAITSDFSSNTLTLVSTTSLDVIETVKMGQDSPVEIAFLVDGESAVITGGYERDRSFVFDIPSRSVRTVIEGAKNRKFPKVPAVSPGGGEVWISYWASNSIGVFDAVTFEPKATIAVGRNPRGIAFTPDGSKAYVCNFCNACAEPSTVHVIDVATRKRTKVIKNLKQPRHAVVSPDGSAVYVSVLGDRKIVKIDTATDTVVSSVRVGNRPKTIKLTPDGKFLFVANYGGNSIMAVDTTLMQVVANVKAGREPSGLSLSADGSRLWTTDWKDGTIRIFDVTYPVEGPPLPEPGVATAP